MSSGAFFAVVLVMAVAAFFAGQQKCLRQAASLGGIRHLDSLPFYYGMLAAIYCAFPALLLGILWLLVDQAVILKLFVATLPAEQRQLPDVDLQILMNTIKNVAGGYTSGDLAPELISAGASYRELASFSNSTAFVALLVLAAAGFVFGILRTRPALRARSQVEGFTRVLLLSCASIAILTTVGIAASVLYESILFFNIIPITDFLFGLEWSPQIAIRADQAGSSGAFGAVPVFTGTLLISLIAMVVAVPTGLMSAIYLSEYAGFAVRRTMKPLLELLAGIPTVVYGFFAALTVAPLVRDLGVELGMSVSAESALAAGLVMGVMIIPFVSSLSDDVINAVPQAMRDGSYALGATQAETIVKVIIPAALPGIVGGVLLAVSRAIGETMIVVMAAGLTANLTANPFESVTTVTAQIATLLVGDQEFDSPKTLAAFALGLMLFLITLMFNVIALHIVKKYREQYE